MLKVHLQENVMSISLLFFFTCICFVWFVPQFAWLWKWPTAPVSSMNQWRRSEAALTERFIKPGIRRAGSSWRWRAYASKQIKMASRSPRSERWLCCGGWSSSTTPMWFGETVSQFLFESSRLKRFWQKPPASFPAAGSWTCAPPRDRNRKPKSPWFLSTWTRTWRRT